MNGEEDGVMGLIEEELVRVDGVIGRVDDALTTNSDQVDRRASSHDSVNFDLAPDSRNTIQVEAEINDVHLNNFVRPPPGFPCLSRSRQASSVASSRSEELRTAQNEAI